MVRTGRDRGDAKSREGGDTRRGSETSGPAACGWLSPGLPGPPVSTCFSSFTSLFKSYKGGGTTGSDLPVVQMEEIRNGFGARAAADQRSQTSLPGLASRFLRRGCARWAGPSWVAGVPAVLLPGFLPFSCHFPSWQLPRGPQLNVTLPNRLHSSQKARSPPTPRR